MWVENGTNSKYWKMQDWKLQDLKMQDRKKEDQKESGWKLKDHSRSYNKTKHSFTQRKKL